MSTNLDARESFLNKIENQSVFRNSQKIVKNDLTISVEFWSEINLRATYDPLRVVLNAPL